MKNYIVSLIAVFATFLLSSYTVEEIPNVHIKDKTQYVTNPDNLISQQTVAGLNSIISNVWQTTSAEMVVVIVKTIGNEEINDFATRLYEHWGIGKKDKSNGVLIFVVEDQRQAVIRTGYGAEGLLPDVICGRIIRNIMAPEFKKGNYDQGLLNTVSYMHKLLTTPGAIDELKSYYKNDIPQQKGGISNIVFLAMLVCGGLSVILLLVVINTAIKNRKKNYFEKYIAIKPYWLPSLILGFLSFGIGFIVTAVIWLMLNSYRNHKRTCPNCGGKMRKLSEEEDNMYLKPAQDLEEKLKSVDYDVWLCGTCGETDIYPFVNKDSAYKECPRCHAMALYCVCDRVMVQPNSYRQGVGVRTFKCLNCGDENNINYKIEKTADPTGAIVAGTILGSLGGRGGGGSFGGGSFGGGMTGGGGASGGW